MKPGTCVRLFTGSAMPAGADAVLMQEDVHAGEQDQVSILDSVKTWENVRLRGEDVKRGATLAEPGEKLTAGRIGLLAAAGVAQVKVGRRPVVGLLATVAYATQRLANAQRRVEALTTAEVRAIPEILKELGTDRRLVRIHVCQEAHRNPLS